MQIIPEGRPVDTAFATIPGGINLTVRPPAPPHVLTILDRAGFPILTVHSDGRVTLDQPDKADEAAQVFADSLSRILQGEVIHLADHP